MFQQDHPFYTRLADEVFSRKGEETSRLSQRSVSSKMYKRRRTVLSSLYLRAHLTRTHSYSLLELGVYSSAATHRSYPSTVIVFKLGSTEDSFWFRIASGRPGMNVHKTWGDSIGRKTWDKSSCGFPPPPDCVKLRAHYYHVTQTSSCRIIKTR